MVNEENAFEMVHLMLEDDGEQLVLWAGENTSPSALAEVTRLFDVRRFEREPEGTLGQGIHRFYRARGFAVPGTPGSAPPPLRMSKALPS